MTEPTNGRSVAEQLADEHGLPAWGVEAIDAAFELAAQTCEKTSLCGNRDCTCTVHGEQFASVIRALKSKGQTTNSQS